ncbi:VOC family protein [Streptococcus phocae subsp. phocae]
METIQNIHHISAIIGNVHENLAFYRNILKLRLVKQTVNFDDPNVYHLYFANQAADNGTLITFFPWDGAEPGRKGSAQVGRIAFRVPKGALSFWKQQLQDHQVPFKETNWFQAPALFFQDLHSLDLALVESDDSHSDPAILGFHGAILLSNDYTASQQFLKHYMGLVDVDQDDNYLRLKTVGDLAHEILLPKTSFDRGSWGPGTGHHIAWNVADLDALKTYQKGFEADRFHVTVVRDRKYFQSIYLRESGKVIYEFATTGPGMAVDESIDQLGQHLQLPDMYESRRSEIVNNLDPLNLD